jgi:hypothetical protein
VLHGFHFKREPQHIEATGGEERRASPLKRAFLDPKHQSHYSWSCYGPRFCKTFVRETSSSSSHATKKILLAPLLLSPSLALSLLVLPAPVSGILARKVALPRFVAAMARQIPGHINMQPRCRVCLLEILKAFWKSGWWSSANDSAEQGHTLASASAHSSSYGGTLMYYDSKKRAKHLERGLIVLPVMLPVVIGIEVPIQRLVEVHLRGRAPTGQAIGRKVPYQHKTAP